MDLPFPSPRGGYMISPKFRLSLRSATVMNSAVQALPSRQEVVKAGEDRTSGWQLVAVVCLLALLYGSIFARLASQWSHDPNFSHGFFVPVFSLYVLWEQRERFSALLPRATWEGLWLLIPGLLCLI